MGGICTGTWQIAPISSSKLELSHKENPSSELGLGTEFDFRLNQFQLRVFGHHLISGQGFPRLLRRPQHFYSQ